MRYDLRLLTGRALQFPNSRCLVICINHAAAQSDLYDISKLDGIIQKVDKLQMKAILKNESWIKFVGKDSVNRERGYSYNSIAGTAWIDEFDQRGIREIGWKEFI